MGLDYEYFTATDDAAAAVAFTSSDDLPSPSLSTEMIGLSDLEDHPSSLPASYRDYGPEEFLRLAAVARHAIANGHHMYCVWEV